MIRQNMDFTSGLPGLDDILQGIRPGDNVVLQVDSIDDYIPFVHSFVTAASEQGRDLVYFRFADHPPLLPESVKADVLRLHPEAGFENFMFEIYDVIEEHGYGACYVFDSLSDLAVDWYSDRMLGNFFLLTCPYLFELETVAYFALLRNRHMAHATDAIHRTAQIVLDVYRNRGIHYVQPIKVFKRQTDTMYMLHERQGDRFVPVTHSATIAGILSAIPQPWVDLTVHRADVWTHTFSAAQALIGARQGSKPVRDAESDRLRQQLLRMAITRDPRLLKKVEEYLEIEDLVEVGKRMIGSGLIGGKSVGMLLARAILRRNDPRWAEVLEPHDSFYIGSDVFYTYLVQSNAWSVRRLLRKTDVVEGLHETRQRLRSGAFPKDIMSQFAEMLNYFGQSPIIVRSSSLLEDAYGNSFSGKYESVFCANQGTPEERLEAFTAAVRSVYVSTLSREALAYRAHWGLLGQDEQMSILVQRVSGSVSSTLFYPHLAGVGFSFNPYAWCPEIDPHAGVLRLVFGLGTRAVDRTDDDYARIVALSAPEKRPESDAGEIRRYTQRRADILNLDENCHESMSFEDVASRSPELPIEVMATRDPEMEQLARERGRGVFPWLLTFDRLFSKTDFVRDMRGMLKALDTAYEHPVDIEFTANFVTPERYRINLLQCRPFQVRGSTGRVVFPESVPADRLILSTRGPIIGTRPMLKLDRIIYVVPEAYGAMPISERHAVARMIGKLTHLDGAIDRRLLLIGPGRWGTSTPSLGIPVSFPEISTVSALCEVAAMREGLIPDLSLGTHFLNDLVEMDMLCLAVYPERETDTLNRSLLAKAPNQLAELLPEAKALSEVVRVIDPGFVQAAPHIVLSVDSVEQKALCYLSSEAV